MFLVSDSCSMLNHVKPQLCVLVLACQAACSTVGACLTSRFHALSAKQTCKQLRFPSEVVSGDVWGGFFFAIFQRRGRGEWRDEGDREAGLQLNVSCASHSAVQSVHRFISNNVLNHAHEDLLPVGDNLKKVTVACGGKSNPSVFLTNELWDEEWLALFWLQVQS